MGLDVFVDVPETVSRILKHLQILANTKIWFACIDVK